LSHLHAETVAQSVATPIEQQMSGVDGMNYMYSLNSNNGKMTFDYRLDFSQQAVTADKEILRINTLKYKGSGSATTDIYQANLLVQQPEAEVINDQQFIEETARLANVRFTIGSTSFLEVLVTQQQYFISQLALAQVWNAEMQSYVQLCQALGGGWTP
jgi:outer membrane protein TolC